MDEVVSAFSRLDRSIRGEALGDAMMSASSFTRGQVHLPSFVQRLRASGFTEPDEFDFIAARQHW
jgi:hypothetical protein